jgi:hypothetical protein
MLVLSGFGRGLRRSEGRRGFGRDDLRGCGHDRRRGDLRRVIDLIGRHEQRRRGPFSLVLGGSNEARHVAAWRSNVTDHGHR